MSYPHIWDNALVGGHTYHGMTLGGVLVIGTGITFEKADYPGLRAIKIGNTIYLASDLADSVSIAEDGTVT